MFDFQHKTRATLCQLPDTDNSTRKHVESEGADRKAKWAEFGCVVWNGNIVISGGKETKKVEFFFISVISINFTLFLTTIVAKVATNCIKNSQKNVLVRIFKIR